MFKLIVFVIAVICYVNASPAPSSSSSSASSSVSNSNFNGFGPDFPFTNFQQIQFPQLPQIKMPQLPQIQMPQLPQIKMPQIPPIKMPEIHIPTIVIPTIKPMTPEDAAKIAAAPGMSGMVESMTSQTVWENGKPVTKTTGFIITNKDGKITKTTF